MTPFQYAWDTKDTFFEWIQKRPAIAENFDGFMPFIKNNRVNWLDWFPVQQEILDGAVNNADAVLMVDIGGGRGRDLAEDQRHVVDTASTEGIERVVHDLFTPQPVKGATVYYTHYILHDWDDESCIQSLKHTPSAMTPGYFKILLNEWVLPDVGCSLYDALLDIQMMLGPTGMERT